MPSGSVLFYVGGCLQRATKVTRPSTRCAIMFLALWLGTQSSPVAATHIHIEVRSAPDDASPGLESVQAEEIVTPMAESIGSGGVRWYLVKTKNGAVGWIKGTDLEAAQLESFLRRLPQPPVSIASESAVPVRSQKAVVVPVHMTGTAVIVPVTLNRKIQTYMILDTGASLTVVSRQVAAQLSLQAASHTSILTANGMIRVPLVPLKSLHVSDAAALDLMVAIHDFSPNPNIGGLLGLDYLSRFHTSLDSRRNRLTLAPR